MKGLSSTQIAELNSRASGGIYFEAIVVTRNMASVPQVKDYYAKFGRKFGFGGNVYDPVPMTFGGIQKSSSMEMPTNTVSLMNPGGMINQYIYKSDVVIRRNDIDMQILFCDRLGRFTLYDSDMLEILVVRGSPGAGTASIFCSLGIRLGDRVPKGTIETSEFPAIRGDAVRSSA
jgi:hypothetical protein